MAAAAGAKTAESKKTVPSQKTVKRKPEKEVKRRKEEDESKLLGRGKREIKKKKFYNLPDY